MPIGLLQKCLADLRSARALATTATERAAIADAIADVLEGIIAAGEMPQVEASKVAEIDPPQPVPADRPMSKLSPFYGMGLKEACPKLLWLIGEKQGKNPQTPREIWEQLKAEGWTSNHNNPAHSVNDALRRRAKTHGDVMLVGSGKWGRTDWFTDDQLEEIKKSMGGMGGRDRGDHIERTKAGMATATRRGARLGATKKLSDEKANQLLDRVRAGLSKEKIGKEFNISTASVTNYVKAQGYNSLRELRDEGRKLRAATDTSTEDDLEEKTRH